MNSEITLGPFGRMVKAIFLMMSLFCWLFAVTMIGFALAKVMNEGLTADTFINFLSSLILAPIACVLGIGVGSLWYWLLPTKVVFNSSKMATTFIFGRVLYHKIPDDIKQVKSCVGGWNYFNKKVVEKKCVYVTFQSGGILSKYMIMTSDK